MTASGAPTHVRHLLVEGRVQGVGFRWFVRERARRLALKGWVKNRDDGSVELMVAGPNQVLDQFVRDIEAGPPGASVQRVREASPDQGTDLRTDDQDHGAPPDELPFPFVIQR